MNCTRARSLLMVYLDSELDAATVVAIQEHLSRCPECRRRFERESALDSLLADRLSEERVPDEVWGRIQGALEPRPVIHWRWLATAAVLLVTLAVALHDSGRPAETLSHELVAAFHGAPSLDDPALVRGRSAVETLLADVHGAALTLPADGKHNGHEVALVGAVRQQVRGAPAINVLFECCGVPTSVYVLPATALPSDLAIPAGRTAEVVVDGIRANALLRGDLLIGVVSSHPGALLDQLRS